jgi:hypothetical protein
MGILTRPFSFLFGKFCVAPNREGTGSSLPLETFGKIYSRFPGISPDPVAWDPLPIDGLSNWQAGRHASVGRLLFPRGHTVEVPGERSVRIHA